MCFKPKFSSTRPNIQFTNQILLLCDGKYHCQCSKFCYNHFVAIKYVDLLRNVSSDKSAPLIGYHFVKCVKFPNLGESIRLLGTVNKHDQFIWISVSFGFASCTKKWVYSYIYSDLSIESSFLWWYQGISKSMVTILKWNQVEGIGTGKLIYTLQAQDFLSRNHYMMGDEKVLLQIRRFLIQCRFSKIYLIVLLFLQET